MIMIHSPATQDAILKANATLVMMIFVVTRMVMVMREFVLASMIASGIVMLGLK